MSRTFRRNTKHLIIRHVGTLDEFERDRWHGRRWHELTAQQRYERSIARFTRDRRSGLYAAPRAFRHEMYNDPMRRAERAEIHRCVRSDCWDDHLTGHHPRGANWYWGWIMS